MKTRGVQRTERSIPRVINAPYYKHSEVMNRLGPENCYNVMRGSHWGNPFIMDDESERDAVCDMFEAYALWRLKRDPHWLDPLKGKHLLCCCAPRRCHAETLLRLANPNLFT